MRSRSKHINWNKWIWSFLSCSLSTFDWMCIGGWALESQLGKKQNRFFACNVLLNGDCLSYPMLRYFSYPPLYKVSRSFEIFLSNFNWAGTTGFDLTWSYRERISFEKGLPGQFPCQIWKDHNILKIFTANILWKLRRRMCAESAIISYLKSIGRETATERETGQARNEFEQLFTDLLICSVCLFSDLLICCQQLRNKMSKYHESAHISISDWRFYFHAIEQTS